MSAAVRHAEADEIDGLSLKELLRRMTCDGHLAFCLTPTALRALSQENGHTASLVAERLLEMHKALGQFDGYAYDREQKKARTGFAAELSDGDFLARMAQLAVLCSKYDPFPFDETEVGYAEQCERRQSLLQKQALEMTAARERLAARTHTHTVVAANGHDADCSSETRTASGIQAPEPRHDAELEPTPNAPSSPEEKLLYLPELYPSQFQLPNLLARCRVVSIGAPNKDRRTYKAQAPLRVTRISGYGFSELLVSYTGEELRTGDIEVWAQLLKLAMPIPLGERVQVRARDLLVALRRGTGGSAYETVRKEVARLQGAVIHLRTRDKAVREQFRQLFPKDPLVAPEATGPIEVSFQLLGASSTDGTHWSVAVPREVRVAFGAGVSSWYSEEDYFSVKSDTARRLFLLYASHANPWPFSVAELGEYLGSTMRRERDLRQHLDAAHNELQRAGLVAKWLYGKAQQRNVVEPTYLVAWTRKQ